LIIYSFADTAYRYCLTIAYKKTPSELLRELREGVLSNEITMQDWVGIFFAVFG
jgi:hypothetical protein